MNFWEKIKKPFDSARGKPILCLAPMADVTDAAFRYIIAKYSKFPYVTYTEFVSADGLILAPDKGRKKLLKNLEYSEIERPIVAQIFSSKPEMVEKAAKLILELGFDGIDINMGCPDRNVERQKAGAALMKNPKLARELIVAAKRGVNNSIPVSVKTRLGYNKDELETWLPELLTENPAAIIIHARTRKEMSKVPARWERIKRAVEIRNEIQTSPPNPLSLSSRGGTTSSSQSAKLDFSSSPFPFARGRAGDEVETLIIGNGDVESVEDAVKKCEESGADGAMLGRAVFGNPWLFANYKPTPEERVEVLLKHTKLFKEKFSGVKNFAIMKKHFKEYLKEPNLRDLKYKLMRAESTEVAKQILMQFDA